MKHGKQAFTLIELLVVICIIAILAAMLLPALQSARDSASSATCVNNLMQMSKAYQMYGTTYADFMPAKTSPFISGGGSCSWVEALKDVMGEAGKASFDNVFFCEADASLDDSGTSSRRPKKSYSLNNLAEAIHPRIPYTLNASGRLDKDTAPDMGFISGNRMTAVHSASDLIVIGENVAKNNSDTSVGYDISDANACTGTASCSQEQAAINRRLTTHQTAGHLFLDGHAQHVKPVKSVPSKYTTALTRPQTQMVNSNDLATKGTGSWTDCPKRKKGETCSGTCYD